MSPLQAAVCIMWTIKHWLSRPQGAAAAAQRQIPADAWSRDAIYTQQDAACVKFNVNAASVGSFAACSLPRPRARGIPVMLNPTPRGPRRLPLNTRGAPAGPIPVQASNLNQGVTLTFDLPDLQNISSPQLGLVNIPSKFH